MLFAHWSWRPLRWALVAFAVSQANAQTALPFALELEVPAQVRAGTRVPLALKMRSTGVGEAALQLDGRPAYDFIISRDNGTPVWHWRHGQVTQDILQLRTLKPNDTLEFAAEWDQRDEEGRMMTVGTYWVRGVLYLAGPRKLETEARLAIVP